jgi:hypothetical protein
MNRKIIAKAIRDWTPRRDRIYTYNHQHGGLKRRVYQSPNRKVFLSVGGDIYDFNLNIGNLIIAWETERNRNN